MKRCQRGVMMFLPLLLAGCAGWGGDGGGDAGHPGGYGAPGGYGYPGRWGFPGYYPPRPPCPSPPAPPLSPAQQQLKYLYEHRDQIHKLPPAQQQQVIKRAKELLKRQ